MFWFPESEPWEMPSSFIMAYLDAYGCQLGSTKQRFKFNIEMTYALHILCSYWQRFKNLD